MTDPSSTPISKIAVAGGSGTVGRHVVDVARAAGFDAIVLSRSSGVDLTTGVGLQAALDGVDVVIDVTSVQTQSAERSRAFFSAVTTRLHRAEQGSGVGHHVALGIVGSTDAPFGYYAGKAEQESLVEGGTVPWTILRATQFHEFAQQMYRQIAVGPISLVPRMFSQPVAAREVAERLVELAQAGPAGRVPDLAGPERLRMRDMVRSYAAAVGGRGAVVEVPLPGGFGRALRDGTILAGDDADHGVQSYAEWVAAIRR
ncbi:NAD(P)H-binding protein [Plantibacter flavus]|uniref:SDR family oxidoreductase n=1 Tax=Plantibacter flavus TaxID=150123 RepID=UPI003F14495A